VTAVLDTVLVVEDEVPMRRFLCQALTSHGFRVAEAGSLLRAHELATEVRPAAILLDLGLPDGDGLDLLRHVREWSDAPVIVLSARDREDDKVMALDAGADDYLTKPFGSGELLARLRVLMRRVRPIEESAPVQFGSIEVDLARRLVTKDRQPVKLTAREYGLLRMFVIHRGKVLTHSQILSELWGPNAEGQTHYLRIYMMRLRQKLEEDPDAPRYFQTESGVGYRLLD
jgi:two-component system, OmpR family, KDP operon response regulator KdpE